MARSTRTEGAATTRAPAAPTAAGAAPIPAAAASTTAGEKKPRSGAPGSVADPTPVEKRTVSCLMNAQYHATREAYLDTVHRWFMFLVIILGATALMDALPKLVHWLFGVDLEVALVKELCTAGAATLAALDLTFDLSNRARAHAMMKRRYFELLSELRAAKKSPDEVGVCLDLYSAEEEPPYRVLLLSCWNSAQRTVFGRSAKQYQISRWGLFWKNCFRRPAVTYPVIEPKS